MVRLCPRYSSVDMPERARVITNGGSQTIELPESSPVKLLAARIDVEEALKNGWSLEFLAVLGSLKDEDIPRPNSEDISTLRNPFK